MGIYVSQLDVASFYNLPIRKAMEEKQMPLIKGQILRSHVERVISAQELGPRVDGPAAILSLSLCLPVSSHEEVASQAFPECPAIKESWHQFKANNADPVTTYPHLSSPFQRVSLELAPNSLHA